MHLHSQNPSSKGKRCIMSRVVVHAQGPMESSQDHVTESWLMLERTDSNGSVELSNMLS